MTTPERAGGRAEGAGAPIRVAIAGATGLIGAALATALRGAGARVLRVTRRASTPDDVQWDPTAGRIDAAKLDGVDAVVNLAGETIGVRWTEERKRRIRDSRVVGTALLARTLAGLATPPRVLVSGSAVGIYGNRGDEVLDETSAPGDDFLARVGVEWEAAADPARAAGIRVVHTRTGLVLAAHGGALEPMLRQFKLGVGGKLGSGEQWMSWISLDDEVRAISFAIRSEEVSGPLNVVAPNPVTGADFARTLARVLGRPSLFSVPRFALEALFGEMADVALLASQRALPRRLLGFGFEFQHPTLEQALRDLLGRN